MSIEQFISRACAQTLVYWASPTDDGYGGSTFSDPVEISGRWEQVQEIVKTKDGEEVLSQARAWVTQDLDEGGYLYLGELDDLDSAPVPTDVENACRILAFSKVPSLGQTDVFIRKASLNIGKSEQI